MVNNYLTVSALNRYIKTQFDNDPELFRVFLKGEISNFKRHQKGHLYFTVKDETSQISAVMFANNKPSIELKDGMRVLLVGRVRVYEVTGAYQVYVDAIKNDGVGDLYVAYEKLKKELYLQGYFNEERKRKLPKYPKKIGVVTSKTGAVIEDIINVTRKRYPLVEIVLYPALVQGDSAKGEIVKQIEKANNDNIVDVLIVGRGGGSIEDLWVFNEKEVALAVFSSKIPVISAVGHETDYTIIDYVADVRAETPSAAAMIATPDIIEVKKHINDCMLFSKNYLINCINVKKNELEYVGKKLLYNSPSNRLNLLKEKYNNLMKNLTFNFRQIIDNKKDIISNLNRDLGHNYAFLLENKRNILNVQLSNLKNLNPLSIMEKGYSIVYKNNEVINDADKLFSNDEIKIKLYNGEVKAIVKE